MIIGYVLALFGIPAFGYIIYLLVDWMIRTFNSTAWIVTAVLWFIIVTIASVVTENN
jgi:hypothetical protein